MAVGGGTGPRQSTDGLATWRLACERIENGEYEQAAAVLDAVQMSSTEGEAALLAPILKAVRRLCLACKQYQEETEWHRQAYEEAGRREQELREQLYTILHLIGNGHGSGVSQMPEALAIPLSMSEGSDHASPGFAQNSGLWRRILTRIRQRRPRQTMLSTSSNVPLAATKQARPSPITPSNVSSEKKEQARPSPIAPPDVSSEETVQASIPRQEKPEQATPTPPDLGQDMHGKRAGPSLFVYSLGPFRVYQDDQPIDKWTSNKSKSIFKYLATHRERPTPKEVLMELFWPDLAPDAARNNLNVAIYGLRQTLRQTHPSFSHILFQDDCYLINPTLDVWVDCMAFEEYVAAAQALEKSRNLEGMIRAYHMAEALYEGEFMAEDRYEDWPAFQRQHLQTQYLALLQHLSRHYLDRGDYATCASVCNKMLIIEPCNEQAHRRLMRCYSRQEQPYLALRQYHLCVERLREDLDAPPSEKTEILYQQIRQGERV
jgi:DNA-binding SARP family transcriptional activator